MNLRFQMSGLVCGLALFASAAGATTPPDDWSHSTFQSLFIAVEGSTGGVTDGCSDNRCGNFSITIRDGANNVVCCTAVVIDFSACSDIQLSCDQLNSTTGQTYLGGRAIMGITNAVGQFNFKVQGAANAVPMAGTVTSPGTNVGIPCAQVYADGVPLAPLLVVAAYDVNGQGSPGAAVNGADASLVGAEVVKVGLGAQARARDDYNFSNSVTGPDASIMASMAVQAALGTGSQNTGPFCP